MTHDDLTSLLAAGAPTGTARSHDCPEDLEIAGYVDGRLDASAHERVQQHLDACGHCRSQAGLLARASRPEASAPVAAAVIERARVLVDPAPRSWRRDSRVWAAAAALVLLVPLLLQVGRIGQPAGGESGSPTPSETRAWTPQASELEVLAPVAGTTVDGSRPSFRWTEVPGTPYYDVRIVTDAGDIVVAERVTGTDWEPPRESGLRPGAEYFLHVDAYPAGGKAVSSGHVPFRIAE